MEEGTKRREKLKDEEEEGCEMLSSRRARAIHYTPELNHGYLHKIKLVKKKSSLEAEGPLKSHPWLTSYWQLMAPGGGVGSLWGSLYPRDDPIHMGYGQY